MQGEAELCTYNLKKTSPPQSRSQAVVCVSTPRMYPRSGYFLVTSYFQKKPLQFECTVCDAKFAYKAILYRHISAYHNGKNCKCLECGKTIRNLKLHIQTKHPFKKAKVHIIGCPACVQIPASHPILFSFHLQGVMGYCLIIWELCLNT